VLRLYDYLESGNSYKVRLLLHQLGVPFERAAVDILKGESRTQAFLQRNPNGRIPLLELEDGTCLAESNAILWYLAEGSALLPASRLQRAQALTVMDLHLAERRFFVGDGYSVADIALYAYSHAA
jgi:glutathione S-transferase